MRRLRRAAQAARRRREMAETRPLEGFAWLPPQSAFLSCPDRVKLLRAGNQVYGKTTVGLAETIGRATGDHPYLDVPTRPIEAWVVCASWSQSLAIQEKLWELAPKDLVHPASKFDPVRGFGGHHPALRFKNGSIVRIKTTQQGALNLASATIDFALFDEPPFRQRVFAEVQKRVLKTRGTIAMTMTPVNAPVAWIRDEVAEGKITDLHFRLEPELLIPEGHDRPLRLVDGTVCDEAWIAEVEGEGLAHEVPVVVHGEWEMRATGRVFTAFRNGGPTSHVTTDLPSGEIEFVLGIDHGTRIAKEVAILCAVDTSGLFPQVWVLDEYVAEGETHEDDDAAAILAMLKRNGADWRKLKWAHGDRPVDSHVGRKGNLDIEDALVRRLRQRNPKLRSRKQLVPRIRSAKRGKGGGAGSKRIGCTYLHRLMVRPEHFHVHPCCERLIASLEKWDWSDSSEWKDAIDALRYGLTPYIRGQRGPVGARPMLRVR